MRISARYSYLIIRESLKAFTNAVIGIPSYNYINKKYSTVEMETGSPVYDQWFNEGYPPGMITCFYGPGGSGKTLSCMLAAIATVAAGKKVIFIDTEQNFS